MIFLCSCLNNPNMQIELKNRISKTVENCRVLLVIYEDTCGNSIENLYEFKTLINCGFKKDNITTLNLSTFTTLNCNDYDVLFIPGGNTFTLLDLVKRKGFDKFIIEFIKSDGFYVGESAGAHIVFDSIEHVIGLDDNNVGLTDFSGLGLISGLLIPHYDESRYWDLVYCQKEYNPVYTLRNDECMCFI